jgi:hypothetical protein
MERVLKLSYEKQPPDPATKVTPTHPWFVFNNSWHLRCPLIGGASPALPKSGEGPDFTANLDFFNNAFVWCDPGRYGPGVCELVELIRHFDWPRSIGTTFDHDICGRDDYFRWFPARSGGEANGTLATRPVFANPGAGIFELTADSQARGNGWARSVSASPPTPSTPPTGVPLRPQADGTLNQGCFRAGATDDAAARRNGCSRRRCRAQTPGPPSPRSPNVV